MRNWHSFLVFTSSCLFLPAVAHVLFHRHGYFLHQSLHRIHGKHCLPPIPSHHHPPKKKAVKIPFLKTCSHSLYKCLSFKAMSLPFRDTVQVHNFVIPSQNKLKVRHLHAYFPSLKVNYSTFPFRHTEKPHN